MECETVNTGCSQQQKPESGLWMIQYISRGAKLYEGLAVVRAIDAHDAECTFRAQSQHNGNNANLKITHLYEIKDSYESMLLAEEYLEITEDTNG